jgi:tetratricopeptide (TPR) repeat protein
MFETALRSLLSVGQAWMLLAVLLCGFAAADARAAAGAGGFDAANRLYEQGRFAEAAAAYQGILKSGKRSEALYFNLGNAWFKSGEPGRAILAYRQAEDIAPRDPDLRANLRFVRSQVPAPTMPPSRWEGWLGGLTVNEWTVLASAAVWLWLLQLVAVQLWTGWRAALRVPVRCAGLASLVLCLGLGAEVTLRSDQTAVVIAREATVRGGPLEEAQPVVTAHDGAELPVLDQKDNWLEVRAGSRSTGWLRRDQVTLVSPVLGESFLR